MLWHRSFNFRYVTNKVSLNLEFFLPEPTVVNLFWILQVSAMDLGNRSEFFGCFMEASSDM